MGELIDVANISTRRGNYAIKKYLVYLTLTELKLVKSLKNPYIVELGLMGTNLCPFFCYQFSTNNNAVNYHKSLKSNI